MFKRFRRQLQNVVVVVKLITTLGSEQWDSGWGDDELKWNYEVNLTESQADANFDVAWWIT